MIGFWLTIVGLLCIAALAIFTDERRIRRRQREWEAERIATEARLEDRRSMV